MSIAAINDLKYTRLLAESLPRPIRTKSEYNRLMELLLELDERDDLSPEEDALAEVQRCSSKTTKTNGILYPGTSGCVTACFDGGAWPETWPANTLSAKHRRSDWLSSSVFRSNSSYRTSHLGRT
jgi:hypothetical protein